MITSFRHDRKKQGERRKLIALLFLLVLVIFFFRSPLQGAFSSLFHQLVLPVWKLKYAGSSGVEKLLTALRSKEALLGENKRLKEALDGVLTDALTQERERRENQELKAILGRSSGKDLLLARVLAAPGNSPYDTLVLDVGENHGVTAGMQIIYNGDIVLGAITEVFGQSSVATLYSSYGNELPVVVGEDAVPALAQGEGGGAFRITLPRGITVAHGDEVVIPALSPQYVGFIDAVVRPEGSSLQELYTTLPVNIETLEWVSVLAEDEVDTDQDIQE